MRTNRNNVTEVAHIRTDLDKYASNYDSIKWNYSEIPTSSKKDSMNNYFDKYGRVHDKPVTESNPCPCNNAWLYTAFLCKLDYSRTYQDEPLNFCAYHLTRHPLDFVNETKSPMSRDEILGMAYLDMFAARRFINKNFWMTNDLPKFELFGFIEQLIELIKNNDNRNYWWKNNLDQMKFLTMRLPLQDRAFIYRTAGLKAPLFYVLYEKLSNIKKPKGYSSEHLAFLKTNYPVSPESWLEAFPDVNHPIYIAAKAKLKEP